jgi:ubiquinone/menaquinone biosynthesis C-methylase UbiE
MRPAPEPWNHNTHYHPLILGAVPAGCGRALDVGCGGGTLARKLRRVVPHVTAIDVDAASIERARRADGSSDVEYVLGDALTHPFAPASFDLVVSVAALHHMDATAALDRMRRLLRPGGVLAVVGLARSRRPADLAYDVAAVLANAARRARTPYVEQQAPTVWPPPETYTGMRSSARRLLPGVRYRRHLYWRYSLVWTKTGR